MNTTYCSGNTFASSFVTLTGFVDACEVPERFRRNWTAAVGRPFELAYKGLWARVERSGKVDYVPGDVFTACYYNAPGAPLPGETP